MKPNFSLSREVILTIIAIFLLGLGIIVSLVVLAFLFSGNIPQFTIPLPPTRLVPTGIYVTPTRANPTITASTATVPSSQSIFSPTPANIPPNSGGALPTPDYSEALAEIGVLDTRRAAPGTTVIIEISVNNFGTLPFTLSEMNVTLTQSDGKALALRNSNPELPQEIRPGETKTLELNFELPSSPTATLKILTVEYDIEGY